MVKGSVTISIEDFQEFCKSAERSQEIRGNFKLAIKELQVGKHVMKHKGKYTAGAVGLSGIGIYSASKSNNLGKLKKSDPRYKIMKQKGWV